MVPDGARRDHGAPTAEPPAPPSRRRPPVYDSDVDRGGVREQLREAWALRGLARKAGRSGAIDPRSAGQSLHLTCPCVADALVGPDRARAPGT